MTNWPEGVQLCTLVFPRPLDSTIDTYVSVEMLLGSAARITWTDGTLVLPTTRNLLNPEPLEVPVSGQPGWLDEQQRAHDSFLYRVTVQHRRHLDNVLVDGPYVVETSPCVGQDTVLLAEVRSAAADPAEPLIYRIGTN